MSTVIVRDASPDRENVTATPPIGPPGLLGANLYHGGWPARPHGFALVIWVGPTQPGPSAGQLPGDLFVPNTF
jgi:hypothetical protein